MHPRLSASSTSESRKRRSLSGSELSSCNSGRVQCRPLLRTIYEGGKYLMFKLGIEILPYHDFPLEEALREVAHLGFSEVNLWSSQSPLAHHVNPGDDPQEIRALLHRYGIHPTALTMYGKTQEEMKQRIEFAAELGIDTVIFDCEANFPNLVSSFLP